MEFVEALPKTATGKVQKHILRERGAGVTVLDLFDLTGKTAIVTGGATGIGRQMADALAELGASLVLCGRNEERCIEVAEEMSGVHGRRCLGLRCDVTDPDQVERRWWRPPSRRTAASTSS